MPPDLSLGIFGVIHIDRLSVVRDELRERVEEEDADAVFVEYPDERPGLADWLRGLLRLPLVVLGFGIYSVVSLAAYAVVTRDLVPPEIRAAYEVADKDDIEVHRIDPHFSVIFSAGGIVSVSLNWMIVVGYLAVFPAAVVTAYVVAFAAVGLVFGTARISRRAGTVTALLVFPVWLLLQISVGSVILFLLFTIVALNIAIYRTIDERNEIMLDRACNLAESSCYENAVLVTGKAHVDDFVERIGSSGISDGVVWIRKFFRNGVRYDQGS